MRLGGIDFASIQDQLKTAEQEAGKIRADLGLPVAATQEEVIWAVLQWLESMHFKIHYTNKLHNVQSYGHLPSITIFNHPTDRACGGRIYIYDRYSLKRKRELLYHEFIHINDTQTPTFSTERLNINKYNGFMLSRENFERLELKTELAAMELAIPRKQLKQDLFVCSYNIQAIVDKHSFLEISSVLGWITLHDHFSGHYAVIIYSPKNENNETIPFKIDEFCYGDSKFDIMNILHNANSIAYQSKSVKEPRSGRSSIDNKEYFCFSFYEKDIPQPLPSDRSPIEHIVTCDRQSIIGWPKDTYEFVTRLQLKPSEPPKAS